MRTLERTSKHAIDRWLGRLAFIPVLCSFACGQPQPPPELATTDDAGAPPTTSGPPRTASPPRCLGSESAIPAPTGPHCVGGIDYHLVDTSRQEIYGRDRNAKREVVARVYYPTRDTIGQKRQRYMMDQATEVIGHTAESPPILSQTAALPLLIMSPGYGVNMENYASLNEDLASHGYVVVAIGHPYASGTIRLSNGATVPPLTEPPSADDEPTEVCRRDLSFALDHFAARPADAPWAKAVDWTRVVAFGHSMGGSVAFEAAYHDPRVVGVANLDGDPVADAMKQGINVPFIAMLNARNFNEQTRGPLCTHMDDPTEPWRNNMSLDSCSFFRNVLARAKVGSGVARFPTPNHMSFSDFPYFRGAAPRAVPNTTSIRSLLRSFAARRLRGEAEDDYREYRRQFPQVTWQAYPVR